MVLKSKMDDNDWNDLDIDDQDDVQGGQSDEQFEHYKVVADPGQQPLRVDRFLSNLMPNTSRNRVQLAAEVGAVRVNGEAVKSNYKVKANDVVTLVLDRPKHDTTIVPEDIPIDIAYEDDDLLVVNKAAGMVVHPGNGNFDGTLVHALAYYLKNTPGYDPNNPEVGLVHRIDKDTDGLLLVAKKPEVKTHLARQFFHKTTGRKYIALVWGRFDESEGSIEGNIARDPKERTRMKVFSPQSGIGKDAITHYSIIETFQYVTLVECRLETGRTHQIRAHMAYIGHPLFGDERYGGTEILRGNRSARYTQFIRNCFELCPRQALHAATLEFDHPVQQRRVKLESVLPDDMQQLIDKWRAYAETYDLE